MKTTFDVCAGLLGLARFQHDSKLLLCNEKRLVALNFLFKVQRKGAKIVVVCCKGQRKAVSSLLFSTMVARLSILINLAR